MEHFMTPPKLEVVYNYGNHHLGFHCINVVSEYDFQTDIRIGLFPLVVKITHIRGMSIELGLSIMNKVGLSTKFQYGSRSYEIWNV